MDTSTQTDPAPSRRRTPLDRARVLDAALELIDRDGLDQLTMRRLAAGLDVEAMSLYRHVENKDDLLAGLADLLWAEIAAEASPDDDWSAWLRTFGCAVRDAVLRHPDAMPVLLTGDVSPISALELFADQLERAEAASLDRDQAISALRAVIAFALGYVATELTCFGPAPADRAETDRQRLIRVSRALPPDTSERILDTALLVCGECDVNRIFSDGLELIVRGYQVDR
jgi:AcrR family transcriptional regulator